MGEPQTKASFPDSRSRAAESSSLASVSEELAVWQGPGQSQTHLDGVVQQLKAQNLFAPFWGHRGHGKPKAMFAGPF